MADFQLTASYEELQGIDGEPIEFEWNMFPEFAPLEILQKIQNDSQERNIEPEDFRDPIIFMAMFCDIDWTRKREEILAGTLGVPWSWKRKEVVWRMKDYKPEGKEVEFFNVDESFILPISSVSTEQFQNGVKSSVWSLKKEDQNSQTKKFP